MVVLIFAAILLATAIFASGIAVIEFAAVLFVSIGVCGGWLQRIQNGGGKLTPARFSLCYVVCLFGTGGTYIILRSILQAI